MEMIDGYGEIVGWVEESWVGVFAFCQGAGRECGFLLVVRLCNRLRTIPWKGRLTEIRFWREERGVAALARPSRAQTMLSFLSILTGVLNNSIERLESSASCQIVF